MQRTSPEATGRRRTVRIDITVQGGVLPLLVGVTYLSDPVDLNFWLVAQAKIFNNDSSVTVTGVVSPTTPLLPHRARVAYVKDASGCMSSYHIEWPETLRYREPDGAVITSTHAFDLDALAVTVLSADELHDDPLDPAMWDQDQHYMDALTRVFFGRSAKTEEIETVSSSVKNSSRLALALSLASSPEWANQVVDDIYRDALDRPAEPAGRLHWSQRLSDGGDTREIAVSIYGSPEAYIRAGGNNEGFVDALYNRILGRNPGPEGRAFWINQLDSGQAQPADLVGFFWQSPEFRAQRVKTVYQRVLGRGPDPSGYAHWTKQLLTTDDVQLAALLATSEEFYDSAQGYFSTPIELPLVSPIGDAID